MKKRFFTLLLAVCILAVSAVNASAHVIYGYKLKGGIGHYHQGTYRYYWLDSALNTSLVQKGIDGWNKSTSYSGVFSEINFAQTTDRPSSVMDYYAAYLADGILGDTRFYMNDGTQMNPTTKDWDFCRVRINISSTAMGTSPLSDFYYIYTSAHEMGHVLGFSENNSEIDSIMCQSKYSSNKYSYPIGDDIRALNALYY